jgi:hypothetical protein
MSSVLMDEYTEIEDDLPEVYEHPDPEDDEGDAPEEVVEKPKRWRKSTCPKSDTGHQPVINVTKRHAYDPDYICAWCGKQRWTNSELEEIANQILQEDKNAELCRRCTEQAKTERFLVKEQDYLPYGKETGHIEWQIQKDEDGNVLVDDEGNALYIGFPELMCEKGHRWYKGEGPRRGLNGPNPILFETHLYNRKRREIQVKEGIPDPAYTMDRWGKRPTHGMYHRTHPQGRKVNTKEQRARNGASFYR